MLKCYNYVYNVDGPGLANRALLSCGSKSSSESDSDSELMVSTGTLRPDWPPSSAFSSSDTLLTSYRAIL